MADFDDINNTFNNYLQEVKKINTFEKREEVINSVKEMIAIFDSIAKVDGIELHYLKSREVLDLKGDSTSEDDFLEAVLVYVETAKNMIGEYLEIKDNLGD